MKSDYKQLPILMTKKMRRESPHEEQDIGYVAKKIIKPYKNPFENVYF